MLNSLLLQTNISGTPASHHWLWSPPPHISEQPTLSFESNASHPHTHSEITTQAPPEPVTTSPVPVKVTYDPRNATNLFTVIARHVGITPTPPDGEEIQVTHSRYTRLVMMAMELKLQSACPKSKLSLEAFASAAPAVW
ncbi:hypothetical protein JAAARDRAFT_194749 [Jaapia argillacea MUCL 33604]|uniref:Uncharacterized protein n=1 Tax=Jaapia argillacea MUCL 33604 TaxID=933084 RepID=A0A067PSI3_9AGAM|nr:hypothetical protein JAAARDRAFT_194749 [Jaapia argillacea MUCL 33604]